MKILQINCVYGYGSTGKLTQNIHYGLKKQGLESVVLYGRRKRIHDEGVYKTCTELEAKIWNLSSRVTGHIYSGVPFGSNNLIRCIKEQAPDVVHLQCLNGFFVNIYSLLEYLKKNKIPTVLTLHAEFMFTGGCNHAVDCVQWTEKDGCKNGVCPYWHTEMKSIFRDESGYMWSKMKSAFDGFGDLRIVSVSPWLKERAQSSSILGDKNHVVVMNGVNTEVFKMYDSEKLRKKHQCLDRKVIFHATPFLSCSKDHMKGGYYVLELAKRMNEVMFIIAGNYDSEVILPKNVVLLGNLSDQKMLAQYYSMADITLLTSKRETFSMVCAESLCCGTPVVGFKAGGPESIAISEYSRFFEYGDIVGIHDYIEADMYEIDKKEIAKAAQQRYAMDTMIEEYIKIYKQFQM